MAIDNLDPNGEKGGVGLGASDQKEKRGDEKG